MANEYENREFKNAAREAGVRGRDWNGKEAINDCSEKFHNKFDRDERDSMSFQEMVEWAEDWWQENGHKYS